MKKNNLKILFTATFSIVFSFYAYSQELKFERGHTLDSFKKAMLSEYEISASEFETYWKKVPLLNNESLKKINNNLNYGDEYYIYGKNTLTTVLQDLTDTELDFEKWDDDTEILYSLFVYKYQPKLFFTITEDFIETMSLHLPDDLPYDLYQLFKGQKIDIVSFATLVEILTDGYLEDDMFTTHISDIGFADKKYIITRNNKKETLLDFLDFCEKELSLNEDQSLYLKDTRISLMDDFSVKRYKNINSETEEPELVAYNKSGTMQDPKTKAIFDEINVYSTSLANNYKTKIETSEENYYYYWSLVFYKTALYAKTKLFTPTPWLEKIIELSNEAININPNKSVYRYYKAISLSELQRNDEAIKEIDLVLTATDTASFLHYHKAKILFDQKKYKSSLEHITKAKKIKSNPSFNLLYDEVYKNNLYSIIPLSNLKLKEVFTFQTDINYKSYAFPWDISINENMLCMELLKIDIENYWSHQYSTRGLIMGETFFYTGVIVDLVNERVIKQPSKSWEFATIDEIQDPFRYSNGIVPVKIHDSHYEFGYTLNYLDKEGMLFKEMYQKDKNDGANSNGYLSSYRDGKAILLDFGTKKTHVFDEKFNKIPHNFIRLIPLGDDNYYEYDRYTLLSFDPTPSRLVSLDGTIKSKYYKEGLSQYHNNWVATDEYQLVNIITAKESLLDLKGIYRVDENNKYIIGESKDGFSIIDAEFGTIFKRIADTDFSNIDSKYTGEEIVEKKYVNGEVSLLDQYRKKIEFPNQERIERVLKIHKDWIIVEYFSKKGDIYKSYGVWKLSE